MNPSPSILSQCTSGGCGAKIGQGELAGLLARIPRTSSPQLLVGYDHGDDAAVYQLDEQRSLISTADFFSPMVEDPRAFGRIAAANALSDVYAMGGKPILALNLVCFPEKLPLSILEEILAGGAEKLAEAGVPLGGGHSIYDREPKYGLAVTGLAQTADLLRNNTPRVGDLLILTKPLGVGIIMAAARGGVAEEATVQKAIACMERLNRYAAEKMTGRDISACTDVTGFGLLNHLLEMCPDNTSAEIYPDSLPFFEEARAFADEYLLTAAGQRNRNHFGGRGNLEALPFALQELLFDPQTSGGLLISVAPQWAQGLLDDIRRDDPLADIIGTITPAKGNRVNFIGRGAQ